MKTVRSTISLSGRLGTPAASRRLLSRKDTPKKATTANSATPYATATSVK